MKYIEDCRDAKRNFDICFSTKEFGGGGMEVSAGRFGSKLILMVLVRMIVLQSVEVLPAEQEVSGWGDFPNSWENTMLL